MVQCFQNRAHNICSPGVYKDLLWPRCLSNIDIAFFQDFGVRNKWKNTLQRKVTGSFRRRALKEMADYSWGVSPGLPGRSVFSPPSSPSPKVSASTTPSVASSVPPTFLTPVETPIRRPGRKRRPAPPPPVQVDKKETPKPANKMKVVSGTFFSFHFLEPLSSSLNFEV